MSIVHNYYPLSPNEIKAKEKMLPKYEAIIGGLYNIPIGNYKNWFLNFLMRKSMPFIKKNLPFVLD